MVKLFMEIPQELNEYIQEKLEDVSLFDGVTLSLREGDLVYLSEICRVYGLLETRRRPSLIHRNVTRVYTRRVF